MGHYRSSLCAGVAAASLLLATGLVSAAQAAGGMTDPDASVTCGAFARTGHGNWTATAPSVLAYNNGMTIPIAPGQSFAPNQTVGGVEVTSTLDRQCGNL